MGLKLQVRAADPAKSKPQARCEMAVDKDLCELQARHRLQEQLVKFVG